MAPATNKTIATDATPPVLTGPQLRALMQTLLHTVPNSPPSQGLSSTPSAGLKHAAAPQSLTAQQSQRRQPQSPVQAPQHQTISIDTSTRIIGHCNTINLSSSPSSTNQALRVEQLVSRILADTPRGNERINLTMQAGVNVVGSKNMVVFGGHDVGGRVDLGANAMGQDENSRKKRRAEDDDGSDAVTAMKRVKLEA
ncbi:hypothetical protein ACLMJK_004198 [Lecanora helva]